MLFRSQINIVILASLVLVSCSGGGQKSRRPVATNYSAPQINTIEIPEQYNEDAVFSFADGLKMASLTKNGLTVTIGFDPSTNLPEQPYIYVSAHNQSEAIKTIRADKFNIRQDRSSRSVGPILSSVMEGRLREEAAEAAFFEGLIGGFITAGVAAATVSSTTSTQGTISGQAGNSSFSGVGSSTSTTTDYGAAAQTAGQQIQITRNNQRRIRQQAQVKYNEFRSAIFKSNTLQPKSISSGLLFFDTIEDNDMCTKYIVNYFDYDGIFAEDDKKFEFVIQHRRGPAFLCR